MKLGTKLVILLAIIVSVVMIVASLITLKQREKSLDAAARNELRAHALTLRIALEEDYLSGRLLDAQRLINRLRENTELHNIILFDVQGNLTQISNQETLEQFRYQEQARRSIATGEFIEIERNFNNQVFLSIVMPLQVGEARIGALEVVQPITFVQSHIITARYHIAITTILLCITILLVVYFVTRYSLTLPIRELLGGALAVGQGDLAYRVVVPDGESELTQLAREFNRMADKLDEQRRKAQREAEERLALERRLKHSEQLAAVGSLAAGVAHEMGAPLQVIDGRAKQLLNHPEAPVEQRQRNLSIIRNQAERITHIVRQLLNLSRPYDLRPRPLNLNREIASAIEAVEHMAARNHVLIDVVLNKELSIEADPNLLHQVFLNICQNAIQAMPEGGNLRVECLETDKHRDGVGFVSVQFTDSGNGIVPENLPHIFDPFFTTKEVGHGTGLGLAVASRIVEEHGGWIEAANADQGGATFNVMLPVSSAVKGFYRKSKISKGNNL